VLTGTGMNFSYGGVVAGVRGTSVNISTDMLAIVDSQHSDNSFLDTNNGKLITASA
jgi:hypothetical protein